MKWMEWSKEKKKRNEKKSQRMDKRSIFFFRESSSNWWRTERVHVQLWHNISQPSAAQWPIGACTFIRPSQRDSVDISFHILFIMWVEARSRALTSWIECVDLTCQVIAIFEKEIFSVSPIWSRQKGRAVRRHPVESKVQTIVCRPHSVKLYHHSTHFVDWGGMRWM